MADLARTLPGWQLGVGDHRRVSTASPTIWFAPKPATMASMARALDHYLTRVWQVEHLVIVGTVASICVLHTAASAGSTLVSCRSACRWHVCPDRV